MNTKRIFHIGPPPHIGWWNATSGMDAAPDIWSWWDGVAWSLGAQPDATAEFAAIRAKTHRTRSNKEVVWSDYYPENARVPRIDPRPVGMTLADINLRNHEFWGARSPETAQDIANNVGLTIEKIQGHQHQLTFFEEAKEISPDAWSKLSSKKRNSDWWSNLHPLLQGVALAIVVFFVLLLIIDLALA